MTTTRFPRIQRGPLFMHGLRVSGHAINRFWARIDPEVPNEWVADRLAGIWMYGRVEDAWIDADGQSMAVRLGEWSGIPVRVVGSGRAIVTCWSERRPVGGQTVKRPRREIA